MLVYMWYNIDMEKQPQNEQNRSDFLNKMDALSGSALKSKKKLSKRAIVGIVGALVLLFTGVVIFIMMSAKKPSPKLKPNTSVDQETPQATDLDPEIEARNKYRETDLVVLAEAVKKYQSEKGVNGQLPGANVKEWKELIKKYIPDGIHDGADETLYEMNEVCKFGENCSDFTKLNWTDNKHQIFVVYNAECKGNTKDDVVVSTTRQRRVAIFMVVEGDRFVCTAN